MGVPVRTCVGCRERAPASDLLRVVARDGAVVPDPSRRLPGRGAHLHRDPACLVLAERRRALPRALRVPAPLDLAPLRAALGHHPDLSAAHGAMAGRAADKSVEIGAPERGPGRR